MCVLPEPPRARIHPTCHVFFKSSSNMKHKSEPITRPLWHFTLWSFNLTLLNSSCFFSHALSYEIKSSVYNEWKYPCNTNIVQCHTPTALFSAKQHRRLTCNSSRLNLSWDTPPWLWRWDEKYDILFHYSCTRLIHSWGHFPCCSNFAAPKETFVMRAKHTAQLIKSSSE